MSYRTALLVFLLVHAGAPALAWLWLSDAMEEGAVKADIRGTGASSGDSILVTVSRTRSTPGGQLELFIHPGTLLVPDNPAMQNMVVADVRGLRIGETQYRRTSSILVPESGAATYVLEAYCAEFNKNNPDSSTAFSMEPPIPRLEDILIRSRAQGLSVNARQAAIWMETDRIGFDEMQTKYPVSVEDWRAAESVAGTGDRPTAILDESRPKERLVSLDNLTDATLHVTIEELDRSLLILEPGQKLRCPIPNGTYLFEIEWSDDENRERRATLQAVVDDSTTHIRLQPPAKKSPASAGLKPAPPRKKLVPTPWRKVSEDGNTIAYTQPLDKSFAVCDQAFEHACIEGCKIVSVTLNDPGATAVTARVTAHTANGESFDAGSAQHAIQQRKPDGSFAYPPSHSPVLNMPTDTIVTRVSIRVQGCGRILVQSVDLDSFLAK